MNTRDAIESERGVGGIVDVFQRHEHTVYGCLIKMVHRYFEWYFVKGSHKRRQRCSLELCIHGICPFALFQTLDSFVLFVLVCHVLLHLVSDDDFLFHSAAQCLFHF